MTGPSSLETFGMNNFKHSTYCYGGSYLPKATLHHRCQRGGGLNAVTGPNFQLKCMTHVLQLKHFIMKLSVFSTATTDHPFEVHWVVSYINFSDITSQWVNNTRLTIIAGCNFQILMRDCVSTPRYKRTTLQVMQHHRIQIAEKSVTH